MVHNISYGFVQSPIQIWTPTSFFISNTQPTHKRKIFVWFFYWDYVNLETDGQTTRRGNTCQVNRSNTSYQSFPKCSLLHTRGVVSWPIQRGRQVRRVPRASPEHLSTCQYRGTNRIARTHQPERVAISRETSQITMCKNGRAVGGY